ncbi:hypothetical protein [Rhodovulum strictum]|uniref:Uncharacterized protein n=1 Tax=Rhodovulum strictum TaxID=58314 RepID=A0A844BFF9_9RHOB|nr:hypothetical protein [Rhodovulum strictum]MRH20105.1 hypothetical protein [Rhodovulum strictum]
MHDPQHEQFRVRLARVERMHRDGHVSELAGTNGWTTPRLSLSVGIPLWRALGMIALAMLVLKAAILAQIGPQAYEHHLASASGASVVQQVATYVMQIDPITEWLAGAMRALIALFS